MAKSSITHNFVIKDKASAEKLANALSAPKVKVEKVSSKTVTGRDAIAILQKWKDGKSQKEEKQEGDL